jgi:hypothetical protein
MPMLAKSIATAASATLLIGCPIAAANARTRPNIHHTATHKPTTHKHTHDKLTGPKRGATHAIGAQLKAVKALQTHAAAFGGPDSATVQAALAADEAAVQTDLDGVATATSVKSLHILMTSAVVTRQIARTQLHDVVAADAAGAQAQTLSAAVTTVEASLADLAASGTDTSAGQVALADATTQLATVTTDVTDVVSAVLAIAPTATKADLHIAAATAGAELAAITDAITAAAGDISSVQTTYGL